MAERPQVMDRRGIAVSARVSHTLTPPSVQLCMELGDGGVTILVELLPSQVEDLVKLLRQAKKQLPRSASSHAANPV